MASPALAPQLVAPLAAAAGAVALAQYFIAPGVDLDGMARGVAGPGTWPKAMLYGAAVWSLAIFCRNLAGLRHARSRDKRDNAEPLYDDGKLYCGIAVLVAYGAGITLVGMGWATLAFLALWLVLSGLRRPLAVLAVSTLGTAGVLYLFVKVCLMPLDRGRGVFEQATIMLYRLLGIY